MVNISVSTNVDLGNCLERIGVIAKEMHPEGIEIFSLPGNYSNTLQLELPQTYAGPEPNQPNANCVEQLNAEYAVKIGKELNKNGIKKIQFHYPWQKDLLDMDGHHLAQTFNFCDLINDEAKADKFTINYHNVFKYPSPRTVNGLDGAARENMIKGLEAKAVNSQYIKKDTGSKIKLIAENNPATSWDDDKKTGQMLLDNVDIVAEDYCDRKGLDGFNLDIPHAESVVKASNANEKNSNIAWMIRRSTKIRTVYGELCFNSCTEDRVASHRRRA